MGRNCGTDEFLVWIERMSDGCDGAFSMCGSEGV